MFDNQNSIDKAFMLRRLKAYKHMFPNLDCLGWYKNDLGNPTDVPVENDLNLQEVIQQACDNPIFLILNDKSQTAMKKKSIPIFLYETNQVTRKFEHLEFALAQSEDERIAVDNVAKEIDAKAKTSALSTNMISSLNAIALLRKKIKFLVEIFKNSKEVRENPAYTRRLNQICN